MSYSLLIPTACQIPIDPRSNASKASGRGGETDNRYSPGVGSIGSGGAWFSCRHPPNLLHDVAADKFCVGWRNGFAQFVAVFHPINPHCNDPIG